MIAELAGVTRIIKVQINAKNNYINQLIDAVNHHKAFFIAKMQLL